MPGTKAIVVRQTQHVVKRFTVTSISGNAWVFTDSTFRLAVRSSPMSVILLLDGDPHLTVDPDDAEAFVLELLPADTAAIPAGEHSYDLWVDDFPVLAGPFVVEPAVSR